MNDEQFHTWVKDYYGKQLKQSADLKTNACCATGAPPRFLRNALSNIHEDVASRFYGCGFPIPDALDGMHVLDLGCGTGRDVYLLSQLVGPNGRVVGIDMTDEQLRVARDTQAWHTERFGYREPNTHFEQGYIEDLKTAGLQDGTFDIVVSNCVVNLSPSKKTVLKEVQRVLKTGGEFYLSDVVADRRLPDIVAQDAELYGECLGGAMYRFDFEQLLREVGFSDVRVIEEAPIQIQNDSVEEKVGQASFYSVTYRLFKLDDLDARCEDYGQTATYLGSLPSHPSALRLDDHHLFEKGRPERVCGNTAAMLHDTRFASHFKVFGTKEVHYGEFPCGGTIATARGDARVPAATSCC